MKSNSRFSILLFVFLVLPSVEVDAGALGFGRKSQVHLSPEVRGRIFLNGDPVYGATVIRTLDYDQEYREETVTGENGAFYFPEEAILSNRPGRLLDETRVRQIVTVHHEGQRYILWYHTPGGISQRSAVSSRLKNMICELRTPEKELLFRNLDNPEFPHAAFSICRWDDGLEMQSIDDIL